MATTVFDISKKLGLDAKAVLAKAKEIGIVSVKVVNSSVDDLTAEWLVEELVKSNPVVGERENIYEASTDFRKRNMDFSPSPYMKSCSWGWRIEYVKAGISWDSTLKHRVYSCPDTPEYNSVVGATALVLCNHRTRVLVDICSVTRFPAHRQDGLSGLAKPFRERAEKYLAEVGGNPVIIQPGVAHRLYFLSTEPWPQNMQALTATASLTEWPAILSICADADRFFRWPRVGELLWPGCVRTANDGEHQFPTELLSRLRRLEIKADTRTNGPAIVSFLAAGGERPNWGNEGWPVHHVFNGADDGNLFTHSAGLVAAHPVAHHLVHESALLNWLLRREAFLRFGFDPNRDFSAA